MNRYSLNARVWMVFAMIAIAAASRLIPHPPNFTPIAALALFGGAYLPGRRAAFLVPLAGLFVSDLALGLHGLLPVVYGAFALIVCLGFWLRSRRTVFSIAAATLASSVLFFALSNLGVWAFDSLYPRTWEGLVACYIAAIPFFQNALLGDAFYSAILFGGLALAERGFPMLREPAA